MQADIVQVVQEYVSLRKSGATYKGLCPFHSEKSPSFHVNRDKGFFHCFGCGAGGDVFKFLELQEKLGFVDAVAAEGCDRFTVHARIAILAGLSPKENRTVPPLRYDWAYRLKAERPGLQIVVNGGIDTQEEATAHLAHADGAMLGRAAYHDPYLLHRLDVAWFEGPPFNGMPRTRASLLQDYRPWVEAWLAEGVPLKHVTRHILGLFNGERGGRAFRQILSEGAHKPGADWSLVERALEATRSG